MGIVYHYTSLEAAWHILHERKLRFTDCEYLADKSELAYCYEMYNEAWSRELRQRGASDAEIDKCVTRCARPYEGAVDVGEPYDLPVRSYLFCTTDAPDNELMWHAYACCDGRAGCVLAFDEDFFERALRIGMPNSPEMVYHQVVSDNVVYERERNLELLRGSISVYLNNLVKASSSSSVVSYVMEAEGIKDDHWSDISHHAPFMKRPQYRDEREKRFVLRVIESPEYEASAFSRADYPLSERRFSPAGQERGLVPFREWDFSAYSQELIRAVYLPPDTSARCRAYRSLKWFLECEGYETTSVRIAGEDEGLSRQDF